MILVGDMHAVLAELDECRAVNELARRTAAETGDHTIVYMGDQTDGHDIVRLAILDFWRQQIKAAVDDGNDVIMLRGNHDMHVSGQGPNALDFLAQPGLTIVDRPMAKCGVIMMPFIRDNQEFVQLAKENSGPSFKTLLCHQTFDGSKYDNGFYAPDGVDANQVPFENIIVGHIHTAQTCGKVTYIGSPRWRTANDANVEKSIVRLNPRGEITHWFDTSAVCRKIVSMDVFPATVLPEFPANADVRLTLRGSSDWLKEAAPAIEARGYSVARIPDALAAPRVTESAPVAESFTSFAQGFKTPNSTPPATLLQLASKYL